MIGKINLKDYKYAIRFIDDNQPPCDWEIIDFDNLIAECEHMVEIICNELKNEGFMEINGLTNEIMMNKQTKK